MEHKKFKHALDKHDCGEMGFTAEVTFKKLAEEKGYLCRVAGREEQFSHVDFILTKGKDEWKVDVKGAKRKKRTDDLVDYSIIWCEIRNGNGGEGWLTKDKNGATIIAFELENEFVLVSRKDLLNLVYKLSDLTKMVTQSKNALYSGYKRFGRKDLLTMIKTTDLLTIKHSIWRK